MSDGRSVAGGSEGVLRRAAFVRGGVDRVDDRAIMVRLVLFFAGRSVSGLWKKALLVLPLLPAVGLGVFVLFKTRVIDQADPGVQQTAGVLLGTGPAFVVANLRHFFVVLTAWMLLFHTTVTARQVARDLREGALLLYFSRPVRRWHYLAARVGASTLVCGGAAVIASVAVVLGHTMNMGWDAPIARRAEPIIGGMLFWPWLAGALIAISLLAALFTSVVAHACSALVRDPGGAALLFGGGVLASIGLGSAGSAVWGSASLARAIDLHHALQAPLFWAMRLVDVESAPPSAMLEAGIGLGIWAAGAIAAWRILSRLLARPPASRGRT